ncbi:cytochrome b/b6 domain-containing protein [Roseobacter sp.]|uniref:cytochrome b/b6 domain-containing protein n=1 Tax=Roseobacter sp. TaxID=1907202 RepID=UPI003299C02B
MALSNTNAHYGGITKTFHWLTALLIVTLIPLGIYANDLPYETSEQLAQKAWLFSLHKTLGVTVFFVALARILWALSQPKPALLHPDRKLESLAAETVHWLLYGSLLLVPLSGWVHHAATSGFAPIWWPFGQNLPLVPKSDTIAATTAGLHIVFERVLAGSVLLHIAGALKHHVIDKDSTLRRMLPGTPAINIPTRAGAHRVAAPIGAALVIWVAALGTGAALGVYGSHDTAVQAAALADVNSDWTVQDGTLEITVTQLGTPVTGSFADWTAAISFDETVTQGVAGQVDVVVSIGSLTLGSVTSEALGTEYLDATGTPTATFNADILRDAAGYTAVGTLTLKDQTQPATLTFDLNITDGVAQMQGALSLDRLAYGVGASQQDEGSLGFNVDVTVALTAQRAAP